MVQCLGYKHGTNCKKVVRQMQHVKSWEIYQLCAKCGKKFYVATFTQKQKVAILKMKNFCGEECWATTYEEVICKEGH